MTNTRLTVILTILFFVLAIVVSASLWLSPFSKEKNVSPATSTYFSLSGKDTFFKSFQREPEESLVVNKTPSPEEQQTALQNIIRKWEERPGSNDFRTAIKTSENISKEQTETEEISTIFNTLIGSSLLDNLAQQSDISDSSEDIIWSGSYSNTVTTPIENAQSDLQEEFRAYGNELATILNTFNLAQGDQTKLLNTFIENPEDTKDLERLTTGYLQLATDIGELKVPVQLKNIQTNLVTSYTLVGELLWDLTLAKDDTELMERILIYNVSSENVAKGHLALISLFKSHGVTFKSYEPGSIFVFTP